MGAGKARATIEPELLTADQAAAMLSIHVSTLYKLKSGGRLPEPVRLSRGIVRWRAQELREWVAAGCPGRREWEARRTAANASGRTREVGR
jgi:predicted DNA-binding transcriptional regulator AlpA